MSVDLETTYLGLKLANPFIVGASPISRQLERVRAAEDAGAAAIVLHSLFQEQLMKERWLLDRYIDPYADAATAVTSYLNLPSDQYGTSEDYLDCVRHTKAAVSIPVIASLNGTSPGIWTDYAPSIADAGADAIELNLHSVPCSAEESGAMLEEKQLELVSMVRSSVRIPIAVKIAPFYSSIPHFAAQLKRRGADGLVLFDRFYHPDIDIDQLEARHGLGYSSPSELPLRLRWLAILSPSFQGSLAASGGVHSAIDALKAIMAGANAVQLVSTLLEHGMPRLRHLLGDLSRWLSEHRYESVRQVMGSMSLARYPDLGAYERTHYIRVLSSESP